MVKKLLLLLVVAGIGFAVFKMMSSHGGGQSAA
jgi:hypothetical protein